MHRLLRKAARVAAQGTDDRTFRLGCVAKRKDGAIVQAYNGYGSLRPRPPGGIKRHPEAHAEYRVLNKSGHGAVLYVARILKDGTLGNARPCGYCRARIKAMKVTKVYYTISPHEFGVWDTSKDIDE